MKRPKLRQMRINKRVFYALDKKSLQEIGWETGDWVSQHIDKNIPYAISLFNQTHWERASKGKKDPIDIAVEESEKREEQFKQIEKRYGKKERANARRKRAMNKFNKGRINEKDLEKEPIKFLKFSTATRIKDLEKTRREIKKNAKEFGSAIQNSPNEAIKRVEDLAKKRVANINEEIKKARQNLKELVKKYQKASHNLKTHSKT
jgi:flagellar hook-basal body complex protein FliE